MKCTCCGKELGEFTTDISYQLPDAVWRIPEEERDKRAKFNSDLCSLGDRFYIRGIAYIPINGTKEEFGWGFWAEVTEEGFRRYLSIYEIDGSEEEPILGTLANTPPGYPSVESQQVQIFFGPASDRPRFMFKESAHPLFREQVHGISIERVHELNNEIS